MIVIVARVAAAAALFAAGAILRKNITTTSVKIIVTGIRTNEDAEDIVLKCQEDESCTLENAFDIVRQITGFEPLAPLPNSTYADLRSELERAFTIIGNRVDDENPLTATEGYHIGISCVSALRWLRETKVRGSLSDQNYRGRATIRTRIFVIHDEMEKHAIPEIN